MYTYCKQFGNRILLRENGGVIKTLYDYQCELFIPSTEKTEWTSVYGSPLQRKTYSKIKEAREKKESLSRVMRVYGAKSFGYQYIRDNYKDANPITPKNLYIANIDIETGRDERGYSSPQEARCPITAVTIEDMGKHDFYVFAYKEDYVPKKRGVYFIKCENEHDLLAKIIKFFSVKYPDIITGWNCLPMSSFVFTDQCITELQHISIDTNTIDGSDNKTSVVEHIYPISIKDKYSINLANGRKIYSSSDHIFPILYAKRGRYTNLLHNKKSSNILFEQDFRVSDIPIDEYACFMKIPYHENTNSDVPDYSDWELYMAGLIYTDGSISDKSNRSNGYKIYQSDYEFLESFDDRLTTSIVGNREKGYSRRVKRSLVNNIIDMIYDEDNNKCLNIQKLSLLSRRQFLLFLSGLLDGDGTISGNAITLCNFEGDLQKIALLCQWNGLFVTEHHPNIRFLNLDISELSLRKHKRWNRFKSNILGRNNSQLSDKIRYKFVDNDLYVRIDSITFESSNEEMIDIKTTSGYFNCYGVITHNCNIYDIPYIINRIKRIVPDGEKYISMLSPFGSVHEKEVHDTYGNERQIYDIVGVNILDYLDLFKKFTYITPENDKLDTVAHLLLGERKIDYAEYSNLQNLYDQNFELFIDYNIRDVYLVSRFDEKLHLFDLVLSLAYKAGVNYKDVLSPVTTWDVLIYNRVMDQNMVPPLDLPGFDGGAYVGAYVKEPDPGMYKWVVSCDLNSLYPHLQMGINISPEKRITDSQMPPELEDIRKQLGDTVDGIQKLLNEEIDTEPLKKYNVTIAPNGQFYNRDADGIIPVILEGLYAERKAVKGSMLEDKQKMEDDPSLDLTNQIATKNTLQMALKILMNSEYGAMANKYFRYYDLRNAEAITSSGQLAILWVAKHLNEFLNNILDTEDVDYVIAIDTDSVYLNLERLVEKDFNDLDTNNIVDALSHWSKNILEPKIDDIYKKLANYINSHKQKMVMKREVIADRGFWTGKKRYALNVHDSEGVRFANPKVKIMGLECVRSSVPEFCREKIKESIKLILTKDEYTVQRYIVDTKDEFMKQPPEEISFPRGTSNIEKWVNEDGMSKKSCPIHVRGAIAYNRFLDTIESIDERIQSGDKVKFCYLIQPNYFQSNVVSYPPGPNKEAYTEIKQTIDYEKQWEGTFYNPVNAIMKVVGWTANEMIRVEDLFCGGEEYGE